MVHPVPTWKSAENQCLIGGATRCCFANRVAQPRNKFETDSPAAQGLRSRQQPLEAALPRLPVREQAVQEAVEAPAVVSVFKVAEFMHDDVIDAWQRRLNQTRVEQHQAARPETAPTSRQPLDADRRRCMTETLKGWEDTLQSLAELHARPKRSPRFVQVSAATT